MAIELGEFAKRLDALGHSVGANLLRATVKSLEKEGLIPHRLPGEEASPAADFLEAERQRQVDIYLSLGFHKELGLSPEEYAGSFPKIDPIPERFKDRFPILEIVDPRIDLNRTCQLGKIKNFIENGRKEEMYKLPSGPYIVWMHDGRKYLGRSVDQVRGLYKKDERGATVHEGVALYLMHPEILRDHNIDMPGTKIEPGGAPCLILWDGKPRLCYAWTESEHSHFGSVSVGRE